MPRRSGKRPMDKTPIQVLFIEDSEVDVELALRSLEQGGFEVSWERVDLEKDLRRVLGSSKPQAILSDFSMPRFDGVDALRLVKEIAPGIPFIFLSGTIGEERAIEAIRLGATDYVLKNNMRRLSTVVRRALSEAGERERVLAEVDRARVVRGVCAADVGRHVGDDDVGLAAGRFHRAGDRLGARHVAAEERHALHRMSLVKMRASAQHHHRRPLQRGIAADAADAQIEAGGA